MMNDQKHSAQVPGQFLGYSLQTSECLRQLLEAKSGTIVSVEVFDDVGVELPDGTKNAIQTKSALASNPISDRSEEWWKAFANWIDAVEKGQLKIESTRFQIRVFSSKSGKLAQSFAAAKTLDEARIALNGAREELWGASPDYPKKATVAKHLAPHVTKVFDADR